ncbi:MAG: cysteine dioxygenase family protein [Pleurocapsa sp. MO_226.B13]|nr:cysteine dioxygenase family protein [Pleurocapsa sp. MO_226.B13]
MNIQSLRSNIRQLKSKHPAPAIAAERLGELVRTFVRHHSLSQLIQSTVSQGLYRRYRLSHPRDDFQIILVAWEPGKKSPIHDHHETIGVVTTLLGEMIETRYQQLIKIGKYCALKPNRRHHLKPSSVSSILPGKVMQLHQMTNPSQQWAATLHVYLEPLETFHLYYPILQPWHVAISKTLWFDDINLTTFTQASLIG